MGNENSSRWAGHLKRSTTEDCLAWDATDWARQEALSPGRIIVGTWMWSGDVASARISYSGIRNLVHFRADLRDARQPWLRVSYRVAAINLDMDYVIPLEIWPCSFGGFRFWFGCPSCDRDTPRRCTRLYLAPDSPYFGCRACHNLVYRSSQQSRRPSRALPTSAASYAVMMREFNGSPHDRDFFRRMDRVIRGLGR